MPKDKKDGRYDRLRVSLFHDEDIPQEEIEKMSRKIDDLESSEQAEECKE